MAKILVVDDDYNVRNIVAQLVERVVFRIFQGTGETSILNYAEDGVMAIRFLEEKRFDMVLTDCEMQPMNGPQLIAEINRRWPGISIALMSGKDAPPDHGAHAFIRKPIKLVDLELLIRKLLVVPFS